MCRKNPQPRGYSLAVVAALFVLVSTLDAIELKSGQVLFEKDFLLRTPAGETLLLPAGSSVTTCGTSIVTVPLNARMVTVPSPCASLFQDGFEG